MDNEKVCKYCGTNEGLVRGRNNSICRICKSCKSKHASEQLTGRIVSLETCKKISKSNMGHKPTEEHRKHMSEAQSGKNHHNFGKITSDETRKNISKSNKFTLKDYQDKYPWFFLFEEMREAPFELYKAGVQVRCKKCINWFTPKSATIISRRISELSQGRDNAYFYCSDECKNSCPMYGLRADYYISNLNHIDKSNNLDYKIFRNEVLVRQRNETLSCYNYCEMCEAENNLEVHHEKPQKTHPHLALDPDNGIILCRSCHLKFGHKDSCNSNSLMNKICTENVVESTEMIVDK